MSGCPRACGQSNTQAGTGTAQSWGNTHQPWGGGCAVRRSGPRSSWGRTWWYRTTRPKNTPDGCQTPCIAARSGQFRIPGYTRHGSRSAPQCRPSRKPQRRWRSGAGHRGRSWRASCCNHASHGPMTTSCLRTLHWRYPHKEGHRNRQWFPPCHRNAHTSNLARGQVRRTGRKAPARRSRNTPLPSSSPGRPWESPHDTMYGYAQPHRRSTPHSNARCRIVAHRSQMATSGSEGPKDPHGPSFQAGATCWQRWPGPAPPGWSTTEEKSQA
mmetsp:Transcript_7425/g.15908  ORF Transcript_7425/g.15908 Transcript_7425/m.15908 type:complete len:270 (-) Transcript_7425:276-1085(-)